LLIVGVDDVNNWLSRIENADNKMARYHYDFSNGGYAPAIDAFSFLYYFIQQKSDKDHS
jgi:hypothetical protein